MSRKNQETKRETSLKNERMKMIQQKFCRKKTYDKLLRSRAIQNVLSDNNSLILQVKAGFLNLFN